MKTWICPVCSEELGELNGWCEYCKVKDGTIVYNPDIHFIREIRISHIEDIMEDKTSEAKTQDELFADLDANTHLTPQERLFSKLFYHETQLVKDMDLLTLRAHREELSKIAFEARARLSAADAMENEHKKKANDGKPKGFARSINADENATNAINTIKERQKKLTKAEKIQAGLEKLGISTADAAKLMQAGTILARLKNPQPTAEQTVNVESPKPIFNPFAKKTK